MPVDRFSLDKAVLPKLAGLDLAPDSIVWIAPPRDRLPAIRLYYEDTSGEAHEEFVDPRTGEFIFRFHFILPFSGVLILATTYFPWSMAVRHPAAERAQHIWRREEGDPSSADWVALFNPNDAKSYVVVERYFPDRRVAIGLDQIVFNPSKGAVIDRFEPKPVHRANNWIDGLHWLQFDHWFLRWLYFFAGLSGCVMIGSGLIFWMHARIRKGLHDPASVRVVRAISVTAICGIMLATCAFLIANRWLPEELTFTEARRHDLEIRAFFGVWLAAFGHAVPRGRAAWRDQCIAIAIGAGAGGGAELVHHGRPCVCRCGDNACHHCGSAIAHQRGIGFPHGTAFASHRDCGMTALILLLMAGAFVLLSCTSLALSLPRNWKLVTGEPLAGPLQRFVRRSGWSALFLALVISIARDGAGFAALIWPLQFALAAFATAMTLSYRPRLLLGLACLSIRGRDEIAVMRHSGFTGVAGP